MIKTLSLICFALMTLNWVMVKLHLPHLSSDRMSPYLCGGRGKRKSDCQIRDFGANGQIDTNCPSGPPHPHKTEVQTSNFCSICFGIDLDRCIPYRHWNAPKLARPEGQGRTRSTSSNTNQWGRLAISIIKEIPTPWGAIAFPRQTGTQPGSVARHTSICGESRRKGRKSEGIPNGSGALV